MGGVLNAMPVFVIRAKDSQEWEANIRADQTRRVVKWLKGRSGSPDGSFSVDDADDVGEAVAAEFGCDTRDAPHRPCRDDDIAAWLKRMRDGSDGHPGLGPGITHDAIDGLLDRYRECADYGLTLRPEDDERGDP